MPLVEMTTHERVLDLTRHRVVSLLDGMRHIDDSPGCCVSVHLILPLPLANAIGTALLLLYSSKMTVSLVQNVVNRYAHQAIMRSSKRTYYTMLEFHTEDDGESTILTNNVHNYR
jgi:hypothetical protein